MPAVDPREIETPHGPARVHRRPAERPHGTLLLGHGAGGGVTSVDLTVAAETAIAAGFDVVLVEQPYRVAGRRSPAPAARLDAAWIAVVEQLEPLRPLIAGGRSSGARVACRTAAQTGAAGVLCLAFPLHPPGRPDKSRLPELDGVTVPALVVQGISDPFGMPPPGPRRTVVQLAGDHRLASDRPGLRTAVADWLASVLAGAQT
jgi:uncharacterized protein